MTLKVGEVGRDIYVGTTFDLSSNTELTIRFTNPDGTVKFNKTKSSDGVTAPATPSPSLPGLGILPANTYMLYTTVALDFETGGAGNWSVCVNYVDGTPKSFDGDDVTLIISAACD